MKTFSFSAFRKVPSRAAFLPIALSLLLFPIGAFAQREMTLLDSGWKFALGDASSPVSDFGAGTEYFNYLTKAASIHNEGPYSLKFDDSAWKEVSVPHDWVTTLPFAPEASHSHGYKCVGYKYPKTSVGWYRLPLSFSEKDRGSHVYLLFEGIFRDSAVWFNGFYMGGEKSGYNSVTYDISEYIDYRGPNVLCVRADATLEEGWFYEGAGIYRDVYLVKTDNLAVEPWGTFVRSELNEDMSSATILIGCEIGNYSLRDDKVTVEHQILDSDGIILASVSSSPTPVRGKDKVKVESSLTLSNPHLWDTEDPYLYTVRTTVRCGGRAVDTYCTRTGIREVDFDSERGFLLNRKVVKLKGFNVHQDHSGTGSAMPEALIRWRIRQLKDMGANAYRSSHNPATKALLDVCDEEGILVIDEARLMGMNRMHLDLLSDMIRRDRNHPSIILWSCGNEEWGIENSPKGTEIAKSLAQHVRLMDPTRHSTVANAGGSVLIEGLDVVGYNYIIQNDVLGRRERHPEWKIVGTEETTGCGTRGVYFNDPSDPGHMRSLNMGSRAGVENVIERGWKFYESNPWAAGVFFWTGFDYRGEPNPLSYPAVDSEFGVLDYCGFPKDEAYYLKAWWKEDEPLLHIFPHWNLRGHEGEDVEIWAYSNCDEVRLTVNGKKLPAQKMERGGHLKWTAKYAPGKIVARGYKDGKLVQTTTVETTGEPSKMELSADRREISSDGRDLSVLTVKVLDSKGRFVPDACIPLEVTVSGDAHILGVGNGDPAFKDPDHPDESDCKSFSVPSFNGLAQILVQSLKGGSGEVRVEVSSGSLAPSRIDLSLVGR